jgi:hypothetical protein
MAWWENWGATEAACLGEEDLVKVAAIEASGRGNPRLFSSTEGRTVGVKGRGLFGTIARARMREKSKDWAKA